MAAPAPCTWAARPWWTRSGWSWPRPTPASGPAAAGAAGPGGVRRRRVHGGRAEHPPAGSGPRCLRSEGEPLDSYHWTLLDRITFPNGCHVAEVEVDPETGSRACCCATPPRTTSAPSINPLLLIGQVQGRRGAGHRAGVDWSGPPTTRRRASCSAVHVHGLHPAARGRPAGSGHPSARRSRRKPTRSGVKGAGQAGAIAAPPAVVAAVLDALAPRQA